MKLFLTTYIFCFSTFLFAQNDILPKDFYKEEKYKMDLYLSEKMNQHSSTIFTDPPSFSVRTMAEWEEVQALTIAWEGYEPILTEIVRNAVEECNVIIACSNPSQVQNYLLNENVDISNVQYLNINTNSIWMRDYGQNTVYKNDVDSIYLVDWVYNRPRPYDDAFPEELSDYLNIDLFQTSEAPYELVATGGNFMSDGFGTAFSSELIIDENDGTGPYNSVNYPNHSEQEIDDIMYQFMGIENYIKMPILPYDVIHHIDMHMKLLDEETLLVAEYPDGISDGPQIEANLQYILDNFTTKYGTPFNVIRIPSPPSTSGAYPGVQPGNTTDGYYRTYTNSVFINETVLVPFYREEYDTIAQRIYEEALPGYNIVGIDCDDYGNNIISLSGAIHCITHTVGVNDPLLISYKKIDDVCLDEGIPYVTLNALVKHRSGINDVYFNYRYEGENQFTSVSMQDNGDDIWGVVMSFDFTSNIEYYVSANSISGKQQVRPMTAPEGFYSFSYQYCEEEPLSTCTLSNGEIVESGWSGYDTGLNYCNTCSCSDGVLLCTYMLCDPCGAQPDAGECDAAFLRYYFNQQTGTCEEFMWGGCGGTVPFETLEECENYCDIDDCVGELDECGVCNGNGPDLYYDCDGNCISDIDEDGICDELDNCPDDYNPNQEDFNSDNIGDECDDIGLEEEAIQKVLIKVVDILGREINKENKDALLLYIYDDGSVEKIYLFNQ